jgi:hypothetical protein
MNLLLLLLLVLPMDDYYRSHVLVMMDMLFVDYLY